MKKLVAILFVLFVGTALTAQEKGDSTKTSTKKDTSYTIEWGNKTIIIMDKDHDDNDDDDDDFEISINNKDDQRLNHFAGVDLGVNGFLNSANSVSLGKDAEFMDLSYGKSISLGLNFWESYIPIAHEKFGVMIGMGVEFNKYSLSRDYTIVNVKDSTFGVVDSSKSINKNLFKSTMLNVPLMFETNIGKDADHSFHLAAGAMVSYRLGSKTKQKYSEDGEDYKVKSRSDYNMNPFRFSLVGRVGYGNFTVFASYSLTPMFENNKGPELYPFTVGVSLVSF